MAVAKMKNRGALHSHCREYHCQRRIISIPQKKKSNFCVLSKIWDLYWRINISALPVVHFLQVLYLNRLNLCVNRSDSHTGSLGLRFRSLLVFSFISFFNMYFFFFKYIYNNVFEVDKISSFIFFCFGFFPSISLFFFRYFWCQKWYQYRKYLTTERKYTQYFMSRCT